MTQGGSPKKFIKVTWRQRRRNFLGFFSNLWFRFWSGWGSDGVVFGKVEVTTPGLIKIVCCGLPYHGWFYSCGAGGRLAMMGGVSNLVLPCLWDRRASRHQAPNEPGSLKIKPIFWTHGTFSSFSSYCVHCGRIWIDSYQFGSSWANLVNMSSGCHTAILHHFRFLGSFFIIFVAF